MICRSSLRKLALTPTRRPRPPVSQSLHFACRLRIYLAFRIGPLEKTYFRAPGSILPFGAEVCSIAERIVLGKGFSWPFYQDTRSDRLDRLRLSLFGGLGLPFLRHLFGRFGDRAAWRSVHHSRCNRLHHPRVGRSYVGCANRILRGLDLGAQPHFFPLAGLRDLEFYRQRPSSFRGLHRHARCRGETNQRALAVACRARGGDRAHQTRFAQRHAVTFLYAALVNHRSFRPCCASAALAGMLFAQRCEGPR